MSVKVRADKIPQDLLQKCIKNCTIKLPNPFKSTIFPKTIKCYKKTDKFYYFPKRFDAILWDYAEQEPVYSTIRPNINITMDLYTNDSQKHLPIEKQRRQLETFEEIVESLVTNGSCLLSASTSYGKTLLFIHIIKKIGLCTIVIAPTNRIKDQWVEKLRSFNILTGYSKEKDLPTDSCDVYVCGPQILTKYKESDLKKYGFVVIDEVHTFSEELCTNLLLTLRPRFLAGCSATPYTHNGVDAAFPLFYGPKDKWIVKKIIKSYVVYQVKTNLQCYALVSESGTTSHFEVLESYYSQRAFHRLLSNIVNITKDERILILFGLNSNGVKRFAEYLDEKSYTNYTCFTGDEPNYNSKKKVLLATNSKAGTGFDDSGIEIIIHAHDTKDITQGNGRVRGDNFVVFDIVHPRKNQLSHAKDRKKTYEETGGIVQTIEWNEIPSLDLYRDD